MGRQWAAANMKIRGEKSSLLGDSWLPVVLWCEVACTAWGRNLTFSQLRMGSSLGF